MLDQPFAGGNDTISDNKPFEKRPLGLCLLGVVVAAYERLAQTPHGLIDIFGLCPHLKQLTLNLNAFRILIARIVHQRADRIHSHLLGEIRTQQGFKFFAVFQ